MTSRKGFTIVELLIVVVVIAILAAITIVSYNGIQNRATDSVVQSDIRQLSKQLDSYNVTNGSYPTSDAELTSIGIKMSKSNYGRNVVSGTDQYNIVYCRPQSDPSRYAIIASSKSGTLYQYVDGTITTIARSSWDTPAIPSATLCTNAGIPTSSPQVWLYQQNVWKTWVGGS